MDRQEPDSTREPTTAPKLDQGDDPARANGETGLGVRDTGQQHEYSGPSHLAGHAWKPGQSGNPRGRPKGTGVTDRLLKLLEQDGRKVAEALAKAATTAALKGDFRFWKEIVDRSDGPVKQQLEASLVMFAKAIDREDFDGA